MSPADMLRWTWTIVGALGTLIGLVAFGIMVWLARDAQLDEHAVLRTPSPRARYLLMLTEGDVTDLVAKAAITAALLVSIGSSTIAGLGAIFAFGNTAMIILLLVASEFFVVLGLLGLLILGLLKRRRRRILFQQIRLSRAAVGQ